jgi:aspartyl/asparaginyl-tRNA synthetase
LAEKYAALAPDTQTEDVVLVAGRVRAIRNSGMFMDIYDATGKVQIYTSKEHSEASVLEMLDMVDIGDIIGVKGTVRSTKRGELSVNTSEITMLAKALLPLPETPYEYLVRKIVTVSPDFSFAYDSVHYSMPRKYLRKQLEIRAGETKIYVYNSNGNLVRTHDRSYTPKSWGVIPAETGRPL